MQNAESLPPDEVARLRGASYAEGEADLFEWASEMAREWWALKVVDDRQFIALLELLHEVEKRVYYERRTDAEHS